MPDVVDTRVRLDKDAVKRDADVMIVANELGISMVKRGNRYSILCPCHDDHNYGNCVINERGFKCFACGKHGDVFFLVQSFLNVSFTEAVRIVADINGGYEHYVIDEDNLRTEYDNARFIKYEDRQFIGLVSNPIYAVVDVTYDYDSLDELREQGYVIEAVDDGDTDAYLVKKCIDPNPLHTLFTKDYEAYKDLIDSRCADCIRRYERTLSWLKNPASAKEYQPEIERLLDIVPLKDWVMAISDSIQRAKKISVMYGNGMRNYNSPQQTKHNMINHAAIAAANGILNEKTGVPF